jgi:hypothetical protein
MVSGSGLFYPGTKDQGGNVNDLHSRESGADKARLPMPPQPLREATSLQGLFRLILGRSC